MLTLTEINHEKHIRTETKAVAKILYKYSYTYSYYVLRKHISKINIGYIG